MFTFVVNFFTPCGSQMIRYWSVKFLFNLMSTTSIRNTAKKEIIGVNKCVDLTYNDPCTTRVLGCLVGDMLMYTQGPYLGFVSE